MRLGEMHGVEPIQNPILHSMIHGTGYMLCGAILMRPSKIPRQTSSSGVVNAVVEPIAFSMYSDVTSNVSNCFSKVSIICGAPGHGGGRGGGDAM